MALRLRLDAVAATAFSMSRGRAAELIAAGKVNLKGIVTDIFGFDDIQNAMDRSVADKANIVKAVVKISE